MINSSKTRKGLLAAAQLCSGNVTLRIHFFIMQIPLKDFFRNPEKTSYLISPDGSHISWLASFESRLNIHIQKSGEDKIHRITNQKDKDVLFYFWMNNQQIGFLKDNNGDENYHLFAVNITDGIEKDLTPFENVKVDVIDELEEIDNEVLIQMNKRNPVFFDVYRLNSDTGELKLIEENPGNITGWITDHDGNVRMASTTDGVNTSLLFREKNGTEFKTILTTNFREGVSPLFFDFKNESVYALSNLNRDKIAIVRFDPQTGKEIELLYEHPEVDIDNLGYSKKRKVITTASYTTWKKEFKFFDALSEKRFKRIRELISEEAEIYITARNKNEDKFIVRTLSDKSLGNYYFYDEEKDTISHLANVSPWLQPDQLCDTQPITYLSRDGIIIHGYLTLPKNSVGKNLPVIVHPHGGPWARDNWHFTPDVQFLANRGFAVLQMNFRGSTGYGKKFWELSFKQWGKTMQDDITDGVQFLINVGIADKNRIGIYGASYGGYAVLAGLTFTPELYACGVDYVGVSSLFSFMETIPPYWEPYLEMMHEMVGHPEKDKELLASSSPLHHIENIKAPLFVAQGAMDPRVKKTESDQIVNALREKEIEVEYMVKENEGHGFTNQENKFEFYEAMEKFFEKYLK